MKRAAGRRLERIRHFAGHRGARPAGEREIRHRVEQHSRVGVLRTLEERDIRFVRLWFTDVLGTLKSIAVAPAELEGAFADGIGFDGSAIEGYSRIQEADVLAHNLAVEITGKGRPVDLWLHTI